VEKQFSFLEKSEVHIYFCVHMIYKVDERDERKDGIKEVNLVSISVS